MVLQLVEQTTAIGWASIGIIFVFLFVFGYAWQGCVWLYCSEIAPLEYRHVGGAFTACGEWLMTWLTVFVGPIGLANVGASFWGWVFSGNVVAIVFVYVSRFMGSLNVANTRCRYFLCPETGGKTLEQVDYLFTKVTAASKISPEMEDVEEGWTGTKGDESVAQTIMKE